MDSVSDSCEPHNDRDAEIMFLRHPLLVLWRSAPPRLRLRTVDRLIFVWLYRLFPSPFGGAIIVRPETLDRWHRNGSRIYWGWKSRRSVDRPKVPTAIRDLVRASQEGPPAESVIRAAVTLKHLAAALLVHVVPLLNERRASTSCFKISNAAICA